MDFVIVGINPIPWSVPDFIPKGKHVQAVKNGELVAYQEAVKDEVAKQMCEGPLYPFEEDAWLELQLNFWRQLTQGQVFGGRKTKSNYADATNLQKSTEDALQDLAFPNDRRVRRVVTEIHEQADDTLPGIIIRITHYGSSLDRSDMENSLDRKRAENFKPITNINPKGRLAGF